MADMQIVPAYKNNVEAQYVEMMVPLYSYGCEKKIKKALSHTKGNFPIKTYTYIFNLLGLRSVFSISLSVFVLLQLLLFFNRIEKEFMIS